MGKDRKGADGPDLGRSCSTHPRVCPTPPPWPPLLCLQRRGLKLNPVTTLYYIAPCCFCFLLIPFAFIEASGVRPRGPQGWGERGQATCDQWRAGRITGAGQFLYKQAGGKVGDVSLTLQLLCSKRVRRAARMSPDGQTVGCPPSLCLLCRLPRS